MARNVNFVWNFVNELSQRSIKERGVFLSAYDMHPYTKGAGKAQWKNGQVFHNGHYFKVWDSYGLSQYKFRSESKQQKTR